MVVPCMEDAFYLRGGKIDRKSACFGKKGLVQLQPARRAAKRQAPITDDDIDRTTRFHKCRPWQPIGAARCGNPPAASATIECCKTQITSASRAVRKIQVDQRLKLARTLSKQRAHIVARPWAEKCHPSIISPHCQMATIPCYQQVWSRVRYGHHDPRDNGQHAQPTWPTTPEQHP